MNSLAGNHWTAKPGPPIIQCRTTNLENAMSTQTLTQPHQSAAPALPGTWKLGAGRAITLCPREGGVVRVAHGRLWATLDGPHRGALNALGDLVLETGDQLRLRPGQRLVVEAWSASGPAYFTWDPVPVAAPRPVVNLAQVVQPLTDLRLALVLGAGAAVRLVAALGGLGWDLLAGRRERASRTDCAFSAQSSACRAHGAMS
jgi:hypothetical protein